MRVFPALAAAMLIATVTNAQVVSSSTPPQPLRWYVAAQLADHTFEIVVPGHAPGLTGVQPYQFTVGYLLASRWAVQAGYSAYHFLDERKNYGTTVTGEPFSEYFYSEAWAKSLPLLLRRRLTRNSTHRFQYDALVGLTFVRYRDKSERIDETNGQVVWQNKWGDQATNAYLTLGPAVSYRFGRHLEGCFDFLLTKNLHSINRTFSTQQLNSTLGFQHGWSLGLRYRFDVSKGKQSE